MKIHFPIKLYRIWPLGLTMLGLIGFLYLAPRLYEDFSYMRDGVAAYGWYTDIEEQNKFIHYAYRVGEQIYAGQEPWDEENSNIYSHKNGDKIEITYRVNRPWISRRNWRMRERWEDSRMWAGIYLSVLFAGILLAVAPRRTERDSAQNVPSKTKTL